MYRHSKTLAYETWPVADESLLVENEFEYPVSFNGKVRFKINLPLDMPQNEVEKKVTEHQLAQKWLEGKLPKKFIVVKGRIINIVL